MTKKLLFVFLILLCSSWVKASKHNPSPGPQHVLWYKQPAQDWMQALPLGNGRFGAMVFGDPVKERIQLNEDSLWPGGPDWGNSKGTPEDLERIRRLLEEGKVEEVDQQIVEAFSYKGIVRSHQTMGDLTMVFEDRGVVENYRRSLNLNTATVQVEYETAKGHYSQKVYTSAADDVMIIELSTTSDEGIDLSLVLSRPQDEGHPTVSVSNPSNNEISMLGEVTQYGGKLHSQPAPLNYGVKFETLLNAEAVGGSITAENGKLLLKGVKQVTLKLVANTSYYHDDFQAANRRTLRDIENLTSEKLWDRHLAEHQKYFNRVQFELGTGENESIPTDVRLERIKEGAEDQGMVADLFQFGRYLLISSSRPGTNPANLQGLWNQHIAAPWNADYHLNVNLQMNYWPAEVTNLSEFHTPLFDFTDRLIERGRITAREQYGMDGAVAHQASDLWAPAFMRAERAYWGSWIHGGGWLAQHYWEHYRYTLDKKFLRDRAYPAMKAFGEFYLDWLVMDEKTGKWVSSPETSPENSYINEEGKRAAVSFGSAMGHQIIGEVFDNILAAAKILEIEDEFVKAVRNKNLKLFPGVVVGPDNRILEWNEPYEEPEKGHRHLSHLYALHPGDDITQATPKTFQAARNSIDYRLQHGGAGTGWSRAWMINFDARLLDGEAAKENVNKFLEISLAENLFDLHPPFQIDGNFGFTAGISEMLLQSHEGFIRILPALPASWNNGSISGLKARGNVEIDIEWKAGNLHQVSLKSAVPKVQRLRYKDRIVEIELETGETLVLNSELEPVK